MLLSLRPHIALLRQYLYPQRTSLSLLAVLLVGSIALRLVNPQIIRYFLDTAQSSAALEVLAQAALLFIAIALLQTALGVAAGYMAENLGWKATNGLRHDLSLHTLRLDMGFHKDHTPGELIERLDGEVNGLGNFFSGFTLQLAGNGLLVGGILAVLFVEDVRVGLGLTIYTLLVLFLLGSIQRFAVANWRLARQTSAAMYGFLEERISGAEEIRAAGAEAYVLRQFYSKLRDLLQHVRKSYVISSLTAESTNLLFSLGYAFGLALGVYLHLRGEATLGTAFLIVYYVGMLSEPLQTIRHQIQDLQQAGASLERVGELLQTRSEMAAVSQSHLRLPGGPLEVAFENVTFQYENNYENNEYVLHKVSFELQPGRVLGVLGRTGSGKTTLSRLLFRLYDPTSGSVRIGGSDLRAIPLDELRGRVGMVTQDVQLFQASLRDNLTFFDRSVSDRQIEAVLDMLGLQKWARSLPHGLDTPLAAGGQGLSAGEAQLLAFARVFLKDPGVIVLDEASSRLDPATETLLENAIDQLLNGRTGLIIAHRLQTVQRADDILILENGRGVEYGPRLALASDPSSRFAGLMKTGLEEAPT